MTAKTLEARVAALEKENKILKKQATQAEDYVAICNLQCAYGFYLEHWMSQEVMDCFALDHPEVSAMLVEGTYKGPAGVRRYFGKVQKLGPESMHMVMQVNPVITFNKDGSRAHGRWYGYGNILNRFSDPLDPTLMLVIYEMDYIKLKGIWKILALRLWMPFAYNRGTVSQTPPQMEGSEMKLSPDEWAPYNTMYPSGYIYPFSFPHPVTGKPSKEAEYNADLKLKPSPFLPNKKVKK
jgi:hypothetical protein